MKVTLSMNEVYLIGINLVGFFVAISHVILYNMATLAIKYAEVVDPMSESGIWVFRLFGSLFYAAAIAVICYLDIVWVLNWYDKQQTKKNKGWL